MTNENVNLKIAMSIVSCLKRVSHMRTRSFFCSYGKKYPVAFHPNKSASGCRGQNHRTF